MGDLVFIDTETTGLMPYDEVWEVAAIRRRPDGTESPLVLQVRHHRPLAEKLPDKFRLDYQARFDWGAALAPSAAAKILTEFLEGRPHLVGVNPAFDAEKLAKLLRTTWDPILLPPWHHHLIDLVAMTIGYQAAQGVPVQLPVSSDELSAMVGVPTVGPHGTPRYARHTAMGDVEWVRDWFDALNRGGDR